MSTYQISAHMYTNDINANSHACVHLLGKQNNQYCIQKMIPKHHILSIFQGSNDYLVPEPQNAKTNKPKRNWRAKHCISSFMGKLLEGQTHSTSERGVGEKHQHILGCPPSQDASHHQDYYIFRRGSL